MKMPTNSMISEKKKALLAYKEKILNEIKYCERSIDDLRANLKKNYFYNDQADSSDSEDDFLSVVDMGPSVSQLKQQEAMLKTCLHATQELTGLTILQSEADVLVEEPKFEGECPATEPGTWREVIAECRIDLIPFTITFFMHTPERKFGPPSYHGLRVVPIKPAHELELSKSVLHSLKLPSDAVEVIRSYAAGYRSRRTTLARLANKYANALFLEPHPEGGFVMKCADLLEVSWRLENKWSPVAPFHHRMKFDLEFMEESYIKIITQAHKQLQDPSIQTDERTLLLAKIITTCLEARGPIDPESDLESKTTERDNDIDNRECESEKRDSEVMAPPKSLPKKVKQKNKDSNIAQKRSLDDGNGNSGAKKMRNDDPQAKKSTAEANNPRKNKMNDVATEGGKKRKLNEDNKVASANNAKNVKESVNTENVDVNSKDNNAEDKTGSAKPKNTKLTENNAKTKNLTENEEKTVGANSKPKNIKESVSNNDNISNTKTKNKITKDAGDTAIKDTNDKTKTKNIKESTKVLKEPAKVDSTAKPKTKIVKESGKIQENDVLKITEAAGDTATKDTNDKTKTKKLKEPTKVLKEPAKVDSTAKPKTKIVKESGKIQENDVLKIAEAAGDTATKDTNDKTKTKKLKEPTKVLKEPAKVDSTAKPKTKIVKESGKNQENVELKITKDAGSTAKKLNESANVLKEPAKVVSTAKPKTKIVKESVKIQENDGNDELKENNTKVEINKKSKTENGKNDTNKVKNVPTKEAGHTKENLNENNVKTKSIEKKKPQANATTKSKENTDANKDAGRPKSKVSEKTTNNENNIDANTNKNDNKTKNTDTAKAKSAANTKNDKLVPKKTPETNGNVANTKNDEQPKKVPEKKNAHSEKITEIANKGADKNIKEKVSNIKNVTQTVKKVTEKNATNIRNKDKISQITTKEPAKIFKEKPEPIKELPSTKNIIKKPIITKIASHRNSLKPQNPPKVTKAGNIKAITTGNTEKENGGKGSIICPTSVKVLLSRQLPTTLKTTSQETFKQKTVKSTNIPRLLKKPAPKVT